jgi:predicted nucleic acid-binding protein
VQIDGRIIEDAWAIQDRYGVSWWDSLIVAAVAGCEYLLTEDLQDGQRFGGVVVMDPFVHKPGEVFV